MHKKAKSKVCVTLDSASREKLEGGGTCPLKAKRNWRIFDLPYLFGSGGGGIVKSGAWRAAYPQTQPRLTRIVQGGKKVFDLFSASDGKPRGKAKK